MKRVLTAITLALLVSSTNALGVPLTGDGATYGVRGVNSVTGSYAELGRGSYGVYGVTDSSSGIGFYGGCTSATGPVHGVYGEVASDAGNGVVGYASSVTGNTTGAYGLAMSTKGIGVFGRAAATTGTTYGTYGHSKSASGVGAIGYASAASGATKGVYGLSISNGGCGVYGYASAGTGTVYGVYGIVSSSDGYAGYFTGGKGVFATGFAMPTGASAGYVLKCDGDGVGTWEAEAEPGWSLTGNADTTAGTDFLGTTDDVALEFKVNNTRSLRIDPNGAFAAGAQAAAIHAGAFVWADSTGAAFASDAADKFMVRATGGVNLYTTSDASIGARLAAGSGTWASVSDRKMKRDAKAVDTKRILEKLVKIPINTWSYKSEGGVTHMGPMAQDLFAAFHLGDSDKSICTVDGDGIAMAAIQGLYQLTQERDAAAEEKVKELEGEVSALQALLDDLLGEQEGGNEAAEDDKDEEIEQLKDELAEQESRIQLLEEQLEQIRELLKTPGK